MAHTKAGLNGAELAEFRRMLERRRQQVGQDVEQMEAEVAELDEPKASSVFSSVPTHPADVGSEQEQKEKDRSLLAASRELLREVDAALDRIGNGTYGVCEAAGEPIGKDRLYAEPWARYCIRCQREKAGKVA